jgi:hypothetical protein
MENIFWSGTKFSGQAQYISQFLGLHKKIGTAQNVLVLVEGQGIRV